MRIYAIKKNAFKCMVCVFACCILSIANYSVEAFAKTNDFNIRGSIMNLIKEVTMKYQIRQ